MDSLKYTWLLWLAMAAAVCLSPIPSMPPLLALMVAGGLILTWVGLNVSPKRVFYSVFLTIIEIFFREIGIRNQFKVPPQNVPTIFVRSSCKSVSRPFCGGPRPRLDLCFVAAKSMRRRFVGALARMSEAIPTSARKTWPSQVLARFGSADGVTVLAGTSFMSQLKPGDHIVVVRKRSWPL